MCQAETQLFAKNSKDFVAWENKVVGNEKLGLTGDGREDMDRGWK